MRTLPGMSVGSMYGIQLADLGPRLHADASHIVCNLFSLAAIKAARCVQLHGLTHARQCYHRLIKGFFSKRPEGVACDWLFWFCKSVRQKRARQSLDMSKSK